MTDLRSLEDIAADYFMTKYDFRELSAHAFREALKEAIEWGSSSRWISIQDRLPIGDHADMWCLVASINEEGEHDIESATYFKADGYFAKTGDCISPIVGEVTHWMPLPEPPKGEK